MPLPVMVKYILKILEFLEKKEFSKTGKNVFNSGAKTNFIFRPGARAPADAHVL
jgi:hypothetical protein